MIKRQKTQNKYILLYVLVMSRTRLSLSKWLSVRLRTKWFWVRVQLQLLKIYSILISYVRMKISKSHDDLEVLQ